MLEAERWSQVDKIFHEALKRKPDERDIFLERECSGDVSLRKEIEALIRSHENAGSFLENAATTPSSGAFAGQTFGPYQIGPLLGAGGMGEVYKARDTRLNRTVAIKVLPSHFSDNSEMKSRFDREAQLVRPNYTPTEEEILKVLGHLHKNVITFFLALCNTGARVNELRMTNVSDFDPDLGTLRIIRKGVSKTYSS
jgi:serine/threonine protein kinase